MSSSTNQVLVPTTLLSESQWTQINQALAPLNKEQLTWVSGYLAGLAHSHQPAQAFTAATAAAPSSSLTILYGSQTGNAKGVAQEYKAKADALGISARLVNMADFKAKQIKKESHIIIVVSTHGEGDAPDDAVELHEFLGSKKAPKLDNVKYAVVGLGDSSYEFFCQTAKDFDQRLAELGAKPVAPRLDCDVDYEAATDAYFTSISDELKQDLLSDNHSQVVPMPGLTNPALTVAAQQYTKKNPFPASLSVSQKITGRNSSKDIRHIEISLEDSGIEYRPGDALGVWFLNDESLVAELLACVGIAGSEEVTVADEKMPICEALRSKFELTQSYPTFVKAYAEHCKDKALQELMADKAALRAYLADKQIIDIVKDFPAPLTAQQLVDGLRPLTPRLYSIASSQSEVEDEVHLTVAVVEYETQDGYRQGGASGFLSKRLEEGGEVKVFVEKNDNFRLPENPDTPVIMIGPGTGIAPFRAFMQQRAEEEASGKNWLFFGNPHFTEDFLYQTEWQRLVKDGVLSKVSLAFSRDQQEKIYVQHRLLEQGAEVYEWLQQGAHLYVCGDASRMANDVNDALITLVEQHGNKTRAEAEKYVTELRRAKRYQKDVY